MSTKIIPPEYGRQGERATFSVDTDLVEPFRYHWRKNGLLIPGAASDKTYSTPPLRKEDLAARYSVKVYGLNGEEVSDEVTLVADVTPPAKPIKEKK